MNKVRLQYILLILIPLSLSSFTHLWNPLGFPSIHIDEAHYMRRIMSVLQGEGPQESGQDAYPRVFDHPYFGQLFVGGILGLAGYPNSLNAGSDVNSIQMLHIVPRILMGVLAIADTFLLFKIVERRYTLFIALISAILFAIMPSTWIFRRVYLDTILMPFLLSSILIALYLKQNNNITSENTKSKYKISKDVLILLSGIFLGLAIYTKIPAFAMMPLVGSLVYFNSGKSLRSLGIWLIPVIILPMMWPLYSVVVGETDLWLQWVLWQVERNRPLSLSLANFFYIDPLVTILGIAGFAITAIRRDFFPLLWISPFLILSYFIGWVQYFHLVVIFPAFCISSAIFIGYLQKAIVKYTPKLASYSVVVFVIVFGFASTTMLITLDVNSTYYQVYSAIAQKVPSSDNDSNPEITLIGSHWWVWDANWIIKHVLNKPHNYIDPHLDSKFKQKILTDKVLIVADPIFLDSLSRKLDSDNLRQIRQLNNESMEIARFSDNVTSLTKPYYPFNTLPIMIWNENHPTGNVSIKSNY